MNVKGQKVSSDWHLYRRGWGPPSKQFLNPDGTATSRAFKLRAKDQGKLSVDVKEMTTAAKAIADPTRFVLFEISVAAVEDIGLSAVHDPLSIADGDDIDNDAHASIVGFDDDDEIKPGLLARASRRIAI